MALNVNYLNPMGYVVSTEEIRDIANGNFLIERKRFKYDLCFANIELFAEIEHIVTENGTEHILHYVFFNNDHLKRIIKAEGEDAKYLLAGRHYHFNSFYRAVNQTTIEYLNQLGAKVSFFYKDPNPKKKGKKKNN